MLDKHLIDGIGIGSYNAVGSGLSLHLGVGQALN